MNKKEENIKNCLQHCETPIQLEIKEDGRGSLTNESLLVFYNSPQILHIFDIFMYSQLLK